MTPFTFPTPGERRNASAIPVPEPVLINLICLAVRAVHEDGGCDDSCPDCENSRETCRRAFSLLSVRGRVQTDDFLRAVEGIQPGDWRR